MPFIAFDQPNLFPPAQSRNTNLLQAPPQCRPTFPHRVPPAIHFLSPLLGLGHATVPLGFKQTFHRSFQHSTVLSFDLLPGLNHQFLQCYSSFYRNSHRLSPLLTPPRFLESEDTLPLSFPTFNSN